MRLVALATLGLATIAPATDGAQGCLAGADDVVEVEVEVHNGGRVEASCPGWEVTSAQEVAVNLVALAPVPEGDARAFRLDPGWLAGDCELRAYRTDGGLTHRTAPVPITEVDDGGRIVLTTPETTQGGIGVGIVPTCGGVKVVSVVPDSSADEAGVRPGARIVAVDGHAVGHDTWDVIDRTAGDLFTEVVVTLRDPDGATREVELERRYLEAPVASQDHRHRPHRH